MQNNTHSDRNGLGPRNLGDRKRGSHGVTECQSASEYYLENHHLALIMFRNGETYQVKQFYIAEVYLKIDRLHTEVKFSFLDKVRQIIYFCSSSMFTKEEKRVRYTSLSCN